ncbi:protein FAM111A-like [Myripristis murdjan]|uniref:protein FAM111A-like n=1 Tax=Myripristis murdjan TaxID=586833 RepID=UPI001175DAEA|nr:protein FAM111A-like [Myripristis murdjan]
MNPAPSVVRVKEEKETMTYRDQTRPRDTFTGQICYVFIHKTGGANTTGKKPLKHYTFRKADYLCVYAERGMTVEEAIKRDGRFIDELSNFTLHTESRSLHRGPPQAQQKPNIELPPGLLQICGPIPENGEACIIGHPAGGVKQMDPTCIMEKVKREEAADSRLKTHNATLFALYPILQNLEKRGIKNIMLGGSKVDDVVTYNTFMYHGSSGSPVFDAHCRVFGLHTAGFTYKFSNAKHSAIEFAHPLIDILKKFVMNPKRDQELLERVRKAVESIELEEVTCC